ncbi:hypothetical protein D9M69_540410 [compost metagenome]
MRLRAANTHIQPAKPLHAADDTDRATVGFQHRALLDMQFQIGRHRKVARNMLAAITDLVQRLAHCHALLVGKGMNGPDVVYATEDAGSHHRW